jgi:hypothetical protein
MEPPKRFESMLSWASGLIISGLGVQLVTCFWLHALSFVLFLTLGGLLTVAGTLLFLYWLATTGSHVTDPHDTPERMHGVPGQR